MHVQIMHTPTKVGVRTYQTHANYIFILLIYIFQRLIFLSRIIHIISDDYFLKTKICQWLRYSSTNKTKYHIFPKKHRAYNRRRPLISASSKIKIKPQQVALNKSGHKQTVKNKTMKTAGSSRLYIILVVGYCYLERNNGKILEFFMSNSSYLEITASLF